MRDLVITLIVFGSVPFILMRPYVGILVWSWLSYMNPHRLAWGFAYDFPFAMIVALATIIAVIITREPRRIPINGVMVLWALFLVWMCITTAFALLPEYAGPALERALKIQLFTIFTVMFMRTKQRIDLLIWVIVFSIGFFGFKGGIFTILTGGSFRVWGPAESFIEDNNAMALATLMIIPLVFYLRKQQSNRWARLALLGTAALLAVSAIGSQSRGALLGSIAIGGFFWLKSKDKLISGIAMVILAGGLLAFMPQSWYDRMDTIVNYQGDGSAMGRLHAWEMAFNLANDRPLGAGFDMWSPPMYRKYSPEEATWEANKAAHSIYFSVLGEHGWVGLILFVSILALTWRSAGRVLSLVRDQPDLAWIGDLTRMLQVSLIAYLVGGTFLSLSYFDLPWHIVGLIVICRDLAERHQAQVGAARLGQPPGAGAANAAGIALPRAGPPLGGGRNGRAPPPGEAARE